MATLALLSWPAIALLMFSRLPALTAIIWATLLPYLFLPEAFEIKLPGLPDVDKTGIIAASLMMGLFFYRPKIKLAFPNLPTRAETPRLKLLLWLCALAVFAGLFLTVMNNREVLRYGDVFIPAARPWDAFSNVVQWGLILAPFWVATRYLSKPDTHKALLTAFVVAGMGYSLLMLAEVRLAPQLHTWVYGYFQHSFVQHVRGGYRPIVFLQHGLWVGFFTYMALISAFALWKITKDSKWLWCALWIFGVLFLSRNLGAFGLAIGTVFVLFALGARLQRWYLLIVAVAVLFFPALRQAQLIPTNQILTAVSVLSVDRAQSLEFRFTNEDELLERAWEKKWTGWGGWGRERVYNERGRYTTTPDGLWIITIGLRGWVGYLGLFGLLTLPMIWLARSRRIKDIPPATTALVLIAAGNLIYMIVNATMTPIGLLVFGAVTGFVVYGGEKAEAPDEVVPQRGARRTARYTRFGQQEPAMRGAMAQKPRRV